MDYKFTDFKWLATMDGFNYPVDVYLGQTWLGTLVAKPAGYAIKMIDSPTGKQDIKQSQNNNFKSKNLAAQVLHRTWQTFRNSG